MSAVVESCGSDQTLPRRPKTATQGGYKKTDRPSLVGAGGLVFVKSQPAPLLSSGGCRGGLAAVLLDLLPRHFPGYCKDRLRVLGGNGGDYCHTIDIEGLAEVVEP